MSAVFIIAIFLLSAISFAIYRTKRRSLKSAAEDEYFPAPPRGLFDEPHAARRADARRPDDSGQKLQADRASHLRELAGRGELSALDEAWATSDKNLYADVLKELLTRDASAENISAISSHVIESGELRANDMLARALLLVWKLSPTDVKITDLLRVAALSDDARLYQDFLEAVTGAWEDGRVPERTAEELLQLFESEYWVLSPEARSSGAGVALKQTLAEVRRRLSARARRETISHGPGEV